MKSEQLNQESQKEKLRHPLVIKVKHILLGLVENARNRAEFSLDANDLIKGYNFSQLCYFVAFLILAAQAIWAEEIDHRAAGFIALIGLARELIRLFEYLWAYTLGKSLILVIYAGTANVSLAFAAMQINMITGVEPTPFIFTLGFTTIVLLPFWIAVASMLFFSFSLILANLWILIRIPIRIIGIKVALHWEDKKHPLITMIMRILLIPLVIYSMAQLASPYFTAAIVDFSPNIVVSENGIEFIQDNAQEDTESDSPQFSEEDAEAIKTRIEESTEKTNFIRQVIAKFLFHFEAYPSSRCQKEDDQRSVIMDENLALMVRKNDEKDYGFEYTVVRCEPRSYD